VIISRSSTGDSTFASIICITDRSSLRRIPPAPTIGSNPKLACSADTQRWTLNSIQTPEEMNNEARQQVGAMMRRQQAYFLENSRFASTFDELGGDFIPDTVGYSYVIEKTNQSAIQYGIAQKANLKSVVGAVFVIPLGVNEATSVGILCENIQPGTFRPAPPIISANQLPTCAPGTTLVRR
jgi:hypothetical protein